MIIDVWMKHPTQRHSNHDMFESLRRSMGLETFEEALPVQLTIDALREGGVTTGLTAAWYGPEGSLISNDEVADFVARSEGTLVPVAGADIRRPMEAVRELRDRVAQGFVALHIDTSAYAAHRYPSELVDYLKGRGRRKVMFGTNYPMMTPARALERFADLALDEATSDAFLHANARRVFKL